MRSRRSLRDPIIRHVASVNKHKSVEYPELIEQGM